MAAGKHLGRKRIKADVSAARKLFEDGHSQAAAAARMLNLSRGTLRRCLAEAIAAADRKVIASDATQ